MTPVSHPPSSSPSWRKLGTTGNCPIFVFDHIDTLTNKKKGSRFDLDELLEGLETFSLKIDVHSAEQLVGNEVLATAVVPLADVEDFDMTELKDKSQAKIEKLMDSCPFQWKKLRATPGMQSSYLDQSMVSHAAIRIGVKLVYCPPATRPASNSVQSTASSQSRESISNKADSFTENPLPTAAPSSPPAPLPTVAPSSPPAPLPTAPPSPSSLPTAPAPSSSRPTSLSTAPAPAFPPTAQFSVPTSAPPSRAPVKDSEDMYVAPAAETVLQEVKKDKKPGKEKEEASLSFDDTYSSATAGNLGQSGGGKDLEKLVTYANPMFRPGPSSSGSS